jgi:NadR type nicotinamide-nucleotide adenylyltransferase
MEERTDPPEGSIIRVVITGPECTGKSTLTLQLARYFHGRYIPEYARDYIANLGRTYTYDDILHIAKVQLNEAREASVQNKSIVFIDTYLIITKVWFEVVFGHFPSWIDVALKQSDIDLYLLCDTSIPWVADPVRENGGEMREKLYLRYKSELDKLGCNYAVIGGIGQQRLDQAIKAVKTLKR